MDKTKSYRLTKEHLGRRWLMCGGFTTTVSITHFSGYDNGVFRDYWIVFNTERLGTFRIGTAPTLEKAREIGIEYLERGEKNV